MRRPLPSVVSPTSTWSRGVTPSSLLRFHVDDVSGHPPTISTNALRSDTEHKGRRLVTVLETFVAFVSLLYDDRGEVEGSVPTFTCSLVRLARTVWDVAIVR